MGKEEKEKEEEFRELFKDFLMYGRCNVFVDKDGIIRRLDPLKPKNPQQSGGDA
jgi:hypothetical protein